MEIERDVLSGTIKRVFTDLGVGAEDAAVLGSELSLATASGYPSHGIGRVATYVAALASGGLNASASLRVIRESPATAFLDGEGGIGILSALKAADIAVQKALSSGVAAVSLGNCGDVARLAPYARRIAESGCIAIVTANDSGGGCAVTPHGSVTPLFSTNPIAAGIPRASREPLVFDLATSQMAIGGLSAARGKNENVPLDVLVSGDGTVITDPDTFFRGLSGLLPLGGTMFGYKGTALALLVDVLSGGLSGDGLSGDHVERDDRNSLFLLAVNPEAFSGSLDFSARVDALVARIHRAEPLPGRKAPRLPGERSAESEKRPLVSVPDALWKELLSIPE